VLSALLRRFRRWIRRVDRSRRAPSGLANLERTRFFFGRLLQADDFTLEQQYFLEKQRRHNRALHGWGIASGLGVEKDEGCFVVISSGYALSPLGDEIVVAEPVRFDICGERRLRDEETAYLAIRYAEHAVRPIPTAASEGDESATEHSRIREGFELRVLTELPSTDEVEWVVLADVVAARGELSVDSEPHRRYVA
jgi:hypothetical protein